MERGTSFMNNKKYQHAKFCYEKANAQEYIDIANAYLLRENAENLERSSKPMERERSKAAFKLAGDAFVHLPHHPTWAKLGGFCYARGNEHRKAGHAFLSADAYPEAAQQFWQVGDFDELHKILVQHRAELKPEEGRRMTERLKLHFLKAENYKYVR
jgi:tetratricopeptide (TPR) repeat protein